MANQHLDRAASWLADYEWHQGDYGVLLDGRAYDPHNEPGAPACKACALGAIAAANGLAVETEAFFAAAKDLVDHLGLTSYLEDLEDADSSIPLGGVSHALDTMINDTANWNDADGRTKSEVIAALRAAAAGAP